MADACDSFCDKFCALNKETATSPLPAPKSAFIKPMNTDNAILKALFNIFTFNVIICRKS